MAETTGIEWTEKTYNPWIGCTKVSPGCTHCYAETYALQKKWLTKWGKSGERVVTKTATDPIKWNLEAQKKGTRYTVFCASLSDVFEDHPDLPPLRNDLWRLVKRTPFLNWMILTKRAENIAKMLPEDWGTGYANVCLMVSVESQQYFDARVPLLQAVPAKYRALSVEPLIAALRIPSGGLKGIDLVIVGGESGKGARPMNPDWVRNARDACVRENVKFFFKQWGNWTPDTSHADKDLTNGAVFTDYDASPVLLSSLTLKERKARLKQPRVQVVYQVKSKKAGGSLLDNKACKEHIFLSPDSKTTLILPLDETELADFSKLETIFTDGLISFWKAGEALREIRDRGLYRATHATFEGYCKERWEISRAEAYRQIGASEVIEDISFDDPSLRLPDNPSQTRPLLKLKTPVMRRQAWGNVIQRAKDESIPISTTIVSEEVLKLKATPSGITKRKPPAKPKAVDPVKVSKSLDAVRRVFGAPVPTEIRHALHRIEGFSGFQRGRCAVFCEVKDEFGGLSNMAAYPLSVNGIAFRTSEALYQACRYPEHPDIQKRIIEAKSPFIAKRIAKSNVAMANCRSDWDDIRVEVMRWCLRIKLLHHQKTFGDLLLSTENLRIVEESSKDNFWGAIPQKSDPNILKGENILGGLLEDLREEIKQGIVLTEVEPPAIPRFLIAGKQVEAVVTASGKTHKPAQP